jgi:hypothetical protein
MDRHGPRRRARPGRPGDAPGGAGAPGRGRPRLPGRDRSGARGPACAAPLAARSAPASAKSPREALAGIGEAVARDPDNPEPHLVRGTGADRPRRSRGLDAYRLAVLKATVGPARTTGWKPYGPLPRPRPGPRPRVLPTRPGRGATIRPWLAT